MLGVDERVDGAPVTIGRFSVADLLESGRYIASKTRKRHIFFGTSLFNRFSEVFLQHHVLPSLSLDIAKATNQRVQLG